MQIQETSNCHYPSGLQNLYIEYPPLHCDGWKSGECGHENYTVPFCGALLASNWEHERNHCNNGNPLGCLGHGILSRITHVTSFAMDMACGLGTPLFCIGGTVAAAGAECFGLGLRCIKPCYGACVPTKAMESYQKQIDDIDACALKTIKCTCCVSTAILGTVISDVVKCPVNLFCPEIANLLCYQQEINLALTTTIASNACPDNKHCCSVY